jgi:hypothetical protein
MGAAARANYCLGAAIYGNFVAAGFNEGSLAIYSL